MYLKITPILKLNVINLIIKLILHNNFCCFPQGLCSHTFLVVFFLNCILKSLFIALGNPLVLQLMDHVADEL